MPFSRITTVATANRWQPRNTWIPCCRERGGTKDMRCRERDGNNCSFCKERGSKNKIRKWKLWLYFCEGVQSQTFGNFMDRVTLWTCDIKKNIISNITGGCARGCDSHGQLHSPLVTGFSIMMHWQFVNPRLSLRCQCECKSVQSEFTSSKDENRFFNTDNTDAPPSIWALIFY